jgi:hypothetical protein
MLPDSNVNEPSSHGSVSFRVHLKKGLPLGTAITNKADIYFDYNLPVTTNTVMNTIAVAAGIMENGKTEMHLLRVFPNPFSGNLNLVYELSEKTNIKIEMMNVLGETVKTIFDNEMQSAGKHNYSLDASKLPQGIYFVKLISEKNVITVKTVKQ